eukprot:695306-Pyramimonas_sp.AAC.1
MRGQTDTRLKNTTVGMLRESCCSEMGWWGYAKRKELYVDSIRQESSDPEDRTLRLRMGSAEEKPEH